LIREKETNDKTNNGNDVKLANHQISSDVDVIRKEKENKNDLVMLVEKSYFFGEYINGQQKESDTTIGH
jgi:hypothetical protein